MSARVTLRWAPPQVLDAIDDGSSALIVAPTSSGKTFIASYCMWSVLNRDSEGIVVFVAVRCGRSRPP